jgi:hypothetical protein
MALPDDILPEDDSNPDTNPVPEDAPAAQPASEPTPIAPPDPVQASDEAEDQSFSDLSEIAASEFEAKNPQPSAAAELPANLSEQAQPESGPQPTADSPKISQPQTRFEKRRQHYRDLNALKGVAAKEFKRKNPSDDFPLGDDSPIADPEADEFRTKVQRFNAAGGTGAGSGGDSGGGFTNFANAVVAHGGQQDEMLTEHARLLNEMIRRLEAERL